MRSETIYINPQLNRFLNIWAYWEHKWRSKIGDYPSSSAMIASTTVEDFRTKCYKPKTPYINELAYRMSFAINHKLAKEKPIQANALIVKYIAPRQEIKTLLSQWHIKQRAFDYRVVEAKKWLSEWIEEDEFFQDYL